MAWAAVAGAAVAVVGGSILNKGGSSADTSGMNAAALDQAALSREQLEWAKQIYAETAPDRAAATARANEISDAQLDATKKQTALTDDYANYSKTTFRPLEQGIVADAQSFDSPEREAANAAKASASVQSAFDNTEAQQRRELARRGVQPGSGKALMVAQGLGTARASALAGAENKARTDTETLGYARKMDAANLGRGLASAQATSAGIAVNQGNSAVTNGLASGNINAQGNQIMTQGYSGAQAGLAGAASTYGNIARIDMQGNDNSSELGMLGQVGGALITRYSDKNLKEGRKKVSGSLSLAQVKKLPSNESWRYKPGTVASDGGKTHQGHMAQDVNRVMGDVVAPGGKVVNLEAMASIGLAAIKEVAKNHEKLSKQVQGLASAKRKARA